MYQYPNDKISDCERPLRIDELTGMNNNNNYRLTVFFEEQFHEQTVTTNRFDGTKISTFCTNICTSSK